MLYDEVVVGSGPCKAYRSVWLARISLSNVD
jgi:hypothetical protein